jgi:hypothetical protein
MWIRVHLAALSAVTTITVWEPLGGVVRCERGKD